MSASRLVDLRSDTVTRPSAEMRKAIASAEVGDDVLDGDPTAVKLEERVADLLGQEAALFFPSGTQANQTAICVLSTPGTEIVLESGAHLIHYEKAGLAFISRVQVRPVDGDRGRLNADRVRTALRPPSPHLPRVSVISIENTHNSGGGTVTSLDDMAGIKQLADELGLPVHLDGARLWNAAASLGCAPDEVAAAGTTVMVSFSKGLGCPAGSCLAGPSDVIREARSVRKMLGGGMRQVGVLAAACLYALDNHLPEIPEDNRRATDLATALAEGGIDVVTPDTNIVMVDIGTDASEAAQALHDRGVGVVPFGPSRLRAVMHRDVSDADVEFAAGVCISCLMEVK